VTAPANSSKLLPRSSKRFVTMAEPLSHVTAGQDGHREPWSP
jgi:hypothetical protein